VRAFAVTRRSAPTAREAVVPAVPVVAGKVASQDVPIYLRGIGTVIAYNTDIVRSQIQGQLTKIAFTEGQPVHAGDLLAQIDPRPYQSQLDQMTATRDRDQAQRQIRFCQPRSLHAMEGKDTPRRSCLDTQKAQVAAAAECRQVDDALIEQAQVQLEYTADVADLVASPACGRSTSATSSIPLIQTVSWW
jgi:multidrug efflux system membrane fusion protein